MRVFKTAWFERFARRNRLADEQLLQAVARAERGLVDAVLGGDLIKQRVSRPGEGRRGGYRTIIVYRTRLLAIFLYGYAKSQQENIDERDLADLRAAAQQFLSLDSNNLDKAVETKILVELNFHEN